MICADAADGLFQVCAFRYMPKRKCECVLHVDAVWGVRAAGAELQDALLAVLDASATIDLHSAGIAPPSAITWLHVHDVLRWAKPACAKGGFAHSREPNWRRAAHWWLHALAADTTLPNPADLEKGHDEALIAALAKGGR